MRFFDACGRCVVDVGRSVGMSLLHAAAACQQRRTHAAAASDYDVQPRPHTLPAHLEGAERIIDTLTHLHLAPYWEGPSAFDSL
jgi:hypothetical protein